MDQRDLLANFTPLHWAAASEHSSPALVNLLLERGADVNAEGGQPVDGFLGVTKTALDLARQRGEQLPALPSDAYATGLSLFALMESGAVAAKDRFVQEGLRYLQRTQLEDGTWHVRRRAFPFQPPMDSGFPHGADGWISGAATSWAILALATAMDPLEVSGVPPGIIAKSKFAAPSAEEFVHALASTDSASVDFARDIQPILERSCVSCHSGERAKGGFVMDSRASLLKGGNRGEPTVVANRSEQSPLLQFVSDQIEDLEMPPVGKRDKFPPLTDEEVARLRSWRGVAGERNAAAAHQLMEQGPPLAPFREPWPPFQLGIASAIEWCNTCDSVRTVAAKWRNCCDIKREAATVTQISSQPEMALRYQRSSSKSPPGVPCFLMMYQSPRPLFLFGRRCM